jgi:hypothetical protein
MRPNGEYSVAPANLARLRGLGARAEIHPEMKAFAKQYGFEYRCHERRYLVRVRASARSL